MIKNRIFTFNDRVIFKDDLIWFKELLLKSWKESYNIYFDFQNINSSLSKVKEIILKNKDNINFNNLYFYNSGDFINIILDNPIYLPKNINLFISETCPIWCIYCENPNDIYTYLSLEDIKTFLSKYSVWDNINFNILWQGDPIFNPELLDIISYIKSLWWHITFFSGWKSLLFIKDFDNFVDLIDEFKINLSASNYKTYNLIHKNKISEEDFKKLVERFKKISSKATFITVLLKENIIDLLNFIKFVIRVWAKWVEVKKNLQYPERDILDNPLILKKLEKILTTFKNIKQINITSNIWSWFTNFTSISSFNSRAITLLDKVIQEENKNLNISEINKLWKCFQFWNSLDIIETKKISLCCHYDTSVISEVGYNKEYYENSLYIDKKNKFIEQTPTSCKKCPMPIDRYNNYLKYKFTNKL